MLFVQLIDASSVVFLQCFDDPNHFNFITSVIKTMILLQTVSVYLHCEKWKMFLQENKGIPWIGEPVSELTFFISPFLTVLFICTTPLVRAIPTMVLQNTTMLSAVTCILCLVMHKSGNVESKTAYE